MLNLSSSSGSGNFIRFSPQANAWTNSNGEEIQLKKVVFDMPATETGWLMLAVGTRDWQADASLGKKGPQPSPEHKRGFIVKFYNKELGLVEWGSNGVGPNMGLEQLYKMCSQDMAKNAGKLPVIEYTGSKLEKIGKGTTRIPAFNLVSWVARPAGMDEVIDEVAVVNKAVAAVRTAPAAAVSPAAAFLAAEDEIF